MRITFAFDLLYFFEENMIGPLDLSVFDVFDYVSFFGLFEEGELLCWFMSEFAFHRLEFLLVDFPVAFQFFVEADLVRDGDRAEHLLILFYLEYSLFYFSSIFTLPLFSPFYLFSALHFSGSYFYSILFSFVLFILNNSQEVTHKRRWRVYLN